MGGILVTIRSWWDSTDRNQRAVALGGAGLLALLLLGTFLFASRPKYELLYTDMNEADKGTVVAEIQSMGVSAKYDVPGEIEVPADKLEEVNMHLASSGKMPKNVHLGLADLDKMNLITTPAQEKVRLQAMLEGELAKSIETLEGVQSARVHINPGDDSPFANTHKPASAGVTITESNTGHLNGEQGRAIATLLQDSVEGLDTEHITVLNQRMEFLFNGADKNSTSSAGNELLTMEDQVSHAEQRELQGKLDQIYGAGSTVVSVHTELDLDTLATTSESITPTDVIDNTKLIEKMQGTGAKALGPAGMVSNTSAPATKDSPGGAGQGYTSTQETNNRGSKKVDTQSTKTPGAIKSMMINVIADSAKITDTRQAALKSIVDGELKNHADDPKDFDDNLTYVTFDTTSATEAAKAVSTATSQNRNQQLIAMLPIGALLVIALLVMKQLSKFSKTHTARVALPDGSTMALSMGGDGHVGEAGAATILAAIEGLSGTGLAHAAGGQGQTDEELDVEDIKNKIHMPLEQLKKMSAERPQMVAMLIKSLLLEDRK